MKIIKIVKTMFGRDILAWCGELSFQVQHTEECVFPPLLNVMKRTGNSVFQPL